MKKLGVNSDEILRQLISDLNTMTKQSISREGDPHISTPKDNWVG